MTWSLEALHMPRLEVIRRVYDRNAGKCRSRYAGQFPPAATVVDHIDFRGATNAGARFFTALPPYGTKHHVLHLSWDQWDPRVAEYELSLNADTESNTLVLNPCGSGTGPAYPFGPLARLSPSWRGTIVGAERMRPQRLPDPGSGSTSASPILPDSPRVQYQTYEAWAAGLECGQDPAPETLVSHYESTRMRESRIQHEMSG
jgi:hypothetical protein